MSRDSLVMIGGGGHAKSCIDVIEQEGKFSICGIVDATLKVGAEVMGYPILGDDTILEKLFKKVSNAFIGVGQIKTPNVRKEIYFKLKKIGYDIPTIVSPMAYLARDVNLGEGSIIMHNALVNVNAIIGRCCIVNTKALVEHDCRVGDFCHLSTASVLNGTCDIGEGSFIGSNMVLKQQTIIEPYSIVYANYLESINQTNLFSSSVRRGGG